MMGLMGNVTNNTTIAELAMLIATYGVTRMSFGYDYTNPRGPTCVVMLVSHERFVFGSRTGKTQMLLEVEALDDAFARLKHTLAAQITVEGAQSGVSANWAL